MSEKPTHIHEVGAPPNGVPSIGRLNEQGHGVLYLADSPDTAFAEGRAVPGELCLSEWRVNIEKLAMANGGIAPAAMTQLFPRDIYEGTGAPPTPTAVDDEVLELVREIYTLNVGGAPLLYRWSIACGRSNGFLHTCDRAEVEEDNGVTKWSGRYPFAAIAYPSTRVDRLALNFALNDRGRSHVQLDHMQWVRRTHGGAHISLDFANSWGQQGRILWTNRPAQLVLKPGEAAKLTKIEEDQWKYETADGTIPWFA